MVNHSEQKEKKIFQERHYPVYLVSACLMGLQTRYDGQIKPCTLCRTFVKDAVWIPICPEQLGGLATPRIAADIINGDGNGVLDGSAKVYCKDGQDVTRQFVLGAYQVLNIAQNQRVDGIVLKSKSPSCGISGRIGVTAALCAQNHFTLKEF
jgi:uncharacterized protein YbbK (DUF523 family)